MLGKNGAVTTAQVSRELGVSVETVRRDFLFLERENRLIRVHGGAVLPNGSVERMPLSERLEMNREEKRMLSEKACEFIKENDIIAIDSGSTATEFADILRQKFNSLTVITNSIDVFGLLQNKAGFKLILIGGTYYPDDRAFCGALALETYKGLHCDKAFIMPAAISLKNGISDCGERTSAVAKQLFECADSIFILADSDKFEKNALYRIAPTSNSFTYITDSEISEELKRLYRENGITVISKERN